MKKMIEYDSNPETCKQEPVFIFTDKAINFPQKPGDTEPAPPKTDEEPTTPEDAPEGHG